MEFLVEFDINVRTEPRGLRSRTARLPRSPPRRSWLRMDICSAHGSHRSRPPSGRVLSLYRAESDTELNSLLQALPLYDWMRITVTPLRAASERSGAGRSMIQLLSLG